MNPLKKLRAGFGSRKLQKAALAEMASYRAGIEADPELAEPYRQNMFLYDSAHLRNFIGEYAESHFNYLSGVEKRAFGRELYQRIVSRAHEAVEEEKIETGISYARFLPAAALAALGTIVLATVYNPDNSTLPVEEKSPQEYAKSFAQEKLAYPKLRYINGERVYISSVYADGIAATLEENAPAMERLLGEFPCDDYYIYTGDFGYLAQSDDCVSIIDYRAISEPIILHEVFNQYTKGISFPNDLAWFKFGSAEYVARELTGSWDRFDRAYGTDYVTSVPAIQISIDTYGGEWSYYASRKGTDILRSIDFGSTPEERVERLGSIVNSLPKNPTVYDVLDGLAAYESRDVLEEKITGAR